MRSSRLWVPSITAGVVAALVLYDASAGINWTLATLICAGGLVFFRRPDAELGRALALPLGFAILLAGAFAITSNDSLHVLDAAIVASLLALAVLVGRTPQHAASYGALDIITAPVRGLAYTFQGTLSSIAQTTRSTRIASIHPVLRGSLLAFPIVAALALLFASADPLFASGRDALYNVFGTWTIGPRVIFGVVFTLFVAGAYSASLPAPAPSLRPTVATPPAGPARLTERRIVLGALAGICWLFVLFQIGYLFFGSPGTAGSGMTYAEYAHRGFGELAVAATFTALVIVATHNDRYFSVVPHGGARASIALPSLVLIAAVVCILISAFQRVSLYEAAYGFSVLRVYAQAYILLTLAVLLMLAWRVMHVFDVRALARNVMTVSLMAFSVIVYWNCDAWVVRANLHRFATTTKLDVNYLVRGLSSDAYGELVRSLPRLNPEDRSTVITRLTALTARDRSAYSNRWFEWNLRRSRAIDALAAAGIHAE